MANIKTVLHLAAVGIKEFLNTPITDPNFPVYLNAIAAVVIPIFLVVLACLFYLLHKKSSKKG